MKAEDVKIGMKVFPEDNRTYVATVAGLPESDGMVKVEWHASTQYHTTEFFHVDDLELTTTTTTTPEEDAATAAKIQAKIDEARDAFEAAFQALAAIEETAHDNGIDLWEAKELNLVSTKELERTVDNNGWSSSSLWC